MYKPNFDKIKLLMKKKKISQEKLAEILEVDRTTVCRWLNGEGRMPVDKLCGIVDSIECEIQDVFS